MVNRHMQTIEVAFRGSVTVHNWINNLKFYGELVPNPTQEAYPHKSSHIKLQYGFQSIFFDNEWTHNNRGTRLFVIWSTTTEEPCWEKAIG